MANQSPFVTKPDELVFFVGCDQWLYLNSLQDSDGTAITTATVTAVVDDEDGNPVSGIDNPLTLAHVASGNYRGLVPDTATLSEGARLTIEITADDGAGRKGFWVRKGIAHEQ